MTTWTEQLREEVKQEYLAADPTPETSSEIIKQIAEDRELSPNGVRQVLVQAGVYVKKEAPATGGSKTTATKKEGGTRVSKDAQLDALRKAIEAHGASVDEDIIAKLTGKAAAYFVTVLSK